ncbi:hypothetical protein WA026_014735 [Henosepilachna vigintioctopunctata]
MQRMPMPYLSDPQLIPRVQKYLESNVDKTYVDIGLMADELQNTYKEYSRRKRSAFRNSVKKAYSIVLRSYGIGDEHNGSSSEDLEESESENSKGDNFHNNMMNNQLMDLYSRQAANKMDENELIDISSDDSEEESSNLKASNGPSTSNKSSKFDVTIQKNVVKLNAAKIKDKLAVVQGKKRKFDSSDMFMSSPKKKKSLATLQEPSVTFNDVAGIKPTLIEIIKMVRHVKHPIVHRRVGFRPPRGFLLHGPPGCGKTLLANAIAGELGIALLSVSSTELVAGVSGESEERIRELFQRAVLSQPCVLFIDEIDAITSSRMNAQKGMERRIVSQILACIDELNKNPEADMVVFIGATNLPDAIDPALRRAGRFDREIRLGIPDEEARVAILKCLTSDFNLASDFDWRYIGTITPGYVGADLLSLTGEASMIGIDRIYSILNKQQKKADELARHKKLMEEKKRIAEREAAQKDSDKGEPEIIVDDEPSGAEDKEKSDTNRSESPVLVIEDDNSKQEADAPIVEEPTEVSNAATSKTDNKTRDKGNEMVPEPIEESIESYSSIGSPEEVSIDVTYEEMRALLHVQNPFSKKLLDSLVITTNDFAEAVQKVQPSSKREGFATVPGVTFDDIGALKDVQKELKKTLLAPIRRKDLATKFGITVPSGILLCGPPGCGKTLLAKAIANEASINFISVKGPELLNMYVGESERAVRTCFERAKNSAPCFIFFDELESLCPKRSEAKESGSATRVVNQMLTEMDGMQKRSDVYLLAATNRPEDVDPAILRPGRIDKILYVGLPSSEERVDILKAITKNSTPLAPDVDLEEIGRSDELSGYTGADLASLVREAATIAMNEVMDSDNCYGSNVTSEQVSKRHFQEAISLIRPSVPEKDRKHYERLRMMYTKIAHNEVEKMELS